MRSITTDLWTHHGHHDAMVVVVGDDTTLLCDPPAHWTAGDIKIFFCLLRKISLNFTEMATITHYFLKGLSIPFDPR